MTVACVPYRSMEAGVKLSRIPPDLRSGTSSLGSGTFNAKIRDLIFQIRHLKWEPVQLAACDRPTALSENGSTIRQRLGLLRYQLVQQNVNVDLAV